MIEQGRRGRRVPRVRRPVPPGAVLRVRRWVRLLTMRKSSNIRWVRLLTIRKSSN